MENTDALKRSGLKNTKCRAAILEIMEQNGQPVTADRLFRQLIEKGLTVSLSTVYRTLEALAANNIVTKLNIMGEDKAFYEYSPMGHRHYLVCLGCKEIRAIDYCPLQAYEETLKTETDYEIFGHKLHFYGYCPECRKKDGGK